MANKVLNTEMDNTPPQICFANFAGDFSPTAANDLRKGTDTEVEFVFLNLADGAAAQSDKVDLGPKFAAMYKLVAAPEMQVAAADAGGEIEFFWSGSSSGTAGTGNAGGATGAVGVYSGYSSDLAEAVRQLEAIGSMVMTDDAVDSVQIGFGGYLFPSDRYGSLIVKNECGQTICDTDDIEGHVVLIPVIPEIQ